MTFDAPYTYTEGEMMTGVPVMMTGNKALHELRSNSDASTTASDTIGPAKGWRHCYKSKVEKIMKHFVKMLEESDLITQVTLSESATHVSVTLEVEGGQGLLMDYVSTLAQETLLESVSQSKCIYVLGYCSPTPFTVHPMGFDATLVAMENATKACWHVFKKGFCRHGAKCTKQHPIYQLPLKICIQPSGMMAPPVSIKDSKAVLTDFVHYLSSQLEEVYEIAQVETIEHTSHSSFTLEVSPTIGFEQHQDLLVDLLKTQVLAITATIGIHVLEYNGEFFMRTPNGFVVVLGGSAPGCLSSASCSVPLNVVIKPTCEMLYSC